MKNIKEILEDLGYQPLIDEKMDAKYKEWKDWYQGYVKDFHTYVNYQGTQYEQTVNMYSLGMWKQIAELWADNMFNPETEIISKQQEWIDDTTQKLNFEQRFNDLQEKTFALGTRATVEYKDDDVKIDYLGYENIHPLRVENGEIVDVAFVSEKDNILYVNIHKLEEGYKIFNHFYKKENDRYVPTEVEGIAEEFNSPVKLFQIHKPAIVNNVSLDSPLGISVLANAIHEIKAVDTAFNALVKEAIHGKIRVYLSQGAFDVLSDDDKLIPFNPNLEEFYLLKGDIDDEKGELVQVSTPDLRINQLIDNLNTQLNLLGRKVGLGDNVFDFKEGTIYVNTSQVISSNSKFYKTREKHGVVMKSNIISIIQGLYWLEKGQEIDVSVQMDDSILHDKEEELNRVMQLYREGIVSEVYVIQKTLGLDEKQAKEFIENQQELKVLDEDVDFE